MQKKYFSGSPSFHIYELVNELLKMAELDSSSFFFYNQVKKLPRAKMEYWHFNLQNARFTIKLHRQKTT